MNITPFDLAQYFGVVLGLIGAWLVASSSQRLRRRGFQMWIGSNMCLISWAIDAHAWGLLGMYAIYSVTSARGWLSNREVPNAAAAKQ